MKASKFSDAQKAFILKQGDDGVPVAEICRKAGISQAIGVSGSRSFCLQGSLQLLTLGFKRCQTHILNRKKKGKTRPYLFIIFCSRYM